MLRAMVLAAGYGTRLRPLTDELPKPLLPLGDRPALAHVAERLASGGVEEALINAHHLHTKIIEFTKSYGFFAHVEYERKIRGTAGGIAGVRGRLGSAPVIVSNADVILDAPIDELVAGVRSAGMCLAVVLRPAGEGRVGVNERGDVVRLRDGRFGEEAHGADYVSVAALGTEVLERLPDWGCLVGDVALPLLRAGGRITTAQVKGECWSLGDSIADYLDANRRWLAVTTGTTASSFVGPDACVAPEVQLSECIVGQGAVVSGHGALTRCVLWPGAQVSAPLSDAVVTSSGVVVQRDGSVKPH